jgi:micrococcal nuclease
MFKYSNLKQNNAKEPYKLHTHLKVLNVVDGDGLIVENILTQEEFEIRLLGIDAPELKRCRKLNQDERETHVPGALLMQLGHMSFKYMLELVPPNSNVSFIQEEKRREDVYSRKLGYIILPNGEVLNEIMIREGYAKPLDKYYCTEINTYKELNNKARIEKKGLYKLVAKF